MYAGYSKGLEVFFQEPVKGQTFPWNVKDPQNYWVNLYWKDCKNVEGDVLKM